MNTKTTSPEAAALLENQQAIAGAASAAGKLEGAIADYNATAAEMRATLPDPGAIELERENLLAAIAIGEKGQADLDALDSRVAKQQEQRQKGQRAVTGIAQTVAGLSRRLGVAQAQLQQLQQGRPALLRRFLLAEAELEGAQYASLGVELAASYRRLTALDELLLGAGQIPSTRTHGQQLHVPAFALESVKPHAPERSPGSNYLCIFDHRWDGTRHETARQIDREKANFRAQGLEID